MDQSTINRLLHCIIAACYKSLVFKLVLVLTVLCIFTLVKPSANALAEDCESTGLDNAFINCGFEKGNLRGWVTQDLSSPFFPLQANGAGITSYGGFFLSDPPQGIYAALTGFDGSGPGTISLAQDVNLDSHADTLTFEYECAWDLQNFGATLNRTFEVNVEPVRGGSPLQTYIILTAVAGTTAIPDSGGDQTASLDISAFAGQAVRISFDWIVPEYFSGPAFCQLDNIYANGNHLGIPTLSEWGMIAAASGLGLIGVFFAVRRRNAHTAM